MSGTEMQRNKEEVARIMREKQEKGKLFTAGITLKDPR
jgi:hypothetical protein